MRVAVVHTRGSVCRCHAAIEGALARGGHEAVVLDGLDLLARGRAALEGAVVAFDHTDVVAGSSRRRGEPRRLLEALGVAVAGGDAASCDLADDKVLARERLARAGVPVPRGGVLERADEPAPGDPSGTTVELGWPRVLKARFEHMSRGLAVVQDLTEQRATATMLLARFGAPLVLEELVRGRELGLTLLERGGPEGTAGVSGLVALPPVEWRLERDVLTEAEKLADGRPLAAVVLEPPALAAVEAAARAAFAALGLRDYARVDLRLDARGRAFVLEVNPRPSVEPDAPTAVAAEAAGTSLDRVILDVLARAERRRQAVGP